MTVAIVGWGHLPFGRLDALSLEDLIVGAGRAALSDAGMPADSVDGIWLGNLNGGFVPDIFAAPLALNCDAGLRWKPAVRVENACASGSAAVYAACDAIEAGRA
ncbi:thiolase domain-containing protein, partial [Pseudomonas aeruginosa]|nr:thiolase domain-containing protein [Pseudomonas aeruginosa]